MQTVLTNEAAFGRDTSGMFGDRVMHKNLGIATSEGEVWEKTRNWTFRTLREFGFGKSLDMEHFIQIASESLFADIDLKIGNGKNSGIIDVELLFNTPILSIIWQMVTGRLALEDKPDIQILSEKGDGFVKSGIFGAGIVNAFPVLRFIFPKALGYDVQMDYFNTCNKVGGNLFRETQSRLKSSPLASQPTNLLEAFVQNSSTDPKIFNCENFQIMFQDLLLGSTDTSSSYLEAALLFLVANPEVQEKIYHEILEVAPNGRFLNFSDRKSMPYTQAFFLETHRKARILQNSVPRRALRDFQYKEYTIKKDTVIMCDTRLYFEDKERWGDPELFRPDRFIGENGELVNASSIISFSFGKRNCPGELHANIVAFLLLTSLLQRYKLSVEETPRLDMRPGMTLKPYPFKAMFTRR
ncbi:methyl farnesoate epoxidase isoform X2 [Folsomia candida]|nr:methyl farnesoate epoxidase isoform X2 [Folsomia candida]